MGGSSTPPPVVIDKRSDDNSMSDFLRAQSIQNRLDQAEARKAEQRSLMLASETAANQAAASGAQQAQQMLGLQNQFQQAKDAQRIAENQRSMGMVGASATGGPYDVNTARQSQMQNLSAGFGAVVPMLPANIQQTASMINPVNLLSSTEKKSQTPSVKFGGG